MAAAPGGAGAAAIRLQERLRTEGGIFAHRKSVRRDPRDGKDVKGYRAVRDLPSVTSDSIGSMRGRYLSEFKTFGRIMAAAMARTASSTRR